MATVTKISKFGAARAGLEMKAWELAALGASCGVFALMSWLLVTDFSARRLIWPGAGEGRLARPIGKVTFAHNKALRQARDQSEFVALSQTDPVYAFDTIVAGPGSALKITLEDRSVVELGENSMIRLNFDSRLRLSGINRETVIEVVSGTVAAHGGDRSSLKVVSQQRTYLATRDKGLELSRVGSRIDAREGKDSNLVQKAVQRAADTARTAEEARRAQELARRQELERAGKEFAKLGGVMTPQAPGPAPLSLADIAAADKARDARDPRTGKVARPVGGGRLHDDSAINQKKVAASAKAAEELLKSAAHGAKARSEQARATQIEPADNYDVKSAKAKGQAAAFEFPVELRWKSSPENALFTVRIEQKGRPDQLVQVKSKGDEARLTHVFRNPGSFTWKIEDAGGAVLSIRNIHIDSRFQAIELADPVLIGREKGSKMWEAQSSWGFLFKWKPVKGVSEYKIRIARNLDASAGVAPLAERKVKAAEFILPYKKDWQAEKMFFAVEAVHPQGFELASNNVPFIFTFLPPKPKVPVNRKEISRARLNEGVVTLHWEALSEADRFTLEIARDPAFKDKVETEVTPDTSFRFYPPEVGKYYWRVRADKDSVSSPFSEPFELTIK